MGSLKDRLLSRKFIVAVITFVVAAVNAITGSDLIAEDIVNDIFIAVGLLAPVFWSVLEAWIDKNGAAAAVQANVARYEIAMNELTSRAQRAAQAATLNGQSDLDA